MKSYWWNSLLVAINSGVRGEMAIITMCENLAPVTGGIPCSWRLTVVFAAKWRSLPCVKTWPQLLVEFLARGD